MSVNLYGKWLNLYAVYLDLAGRGRVEVLAEDVEQAARLGAKMLGCRRDQVIVRYLKSVWSKSLGSC